MSMERMNETKGDYMTYVKQVTITTSEARELDHMGFFLILKAMHLDGMDTYEVYVK